MVVVPNTSLVETVAEPQKAISDLYELTGYGRAKMNKEHLKPGDLERFCYWKWYQHLEVVR